jgi:hypothetical protein
LDAIERRFPSREARALVAEVRRLNTIATCAGDLRALETARLTTTPKLLLTALVERLGGSNGTTGEPRLTGGRGARRPLHMLSELDRLGVNVAFAGLLDRQPIRRAPAPGREDP